MHPPFKTTHPFTLQIKHLKTIVNSRLFRVHRPQILTNQSLLQVQTNSHISLLRHPYRAPSKYKDSSNNSSTSKERQTPTKVFLRIHNPNSCLQYHSRFNIYRNPLMVRLQARFKGSKAHLCSGHNQDPHPQLLPSSLNVTPYSRLNLYSNHNTFIRTKCLKINSHNKLTLYNMSSQELLLSLVNQLLTHNSNNQSRDTIPKPLVLSHRLPPQTQCASKITKRNSLVHLPTQARFLPLVPHVLV